MCNGGGGQRKDRTADDLIKLLLERNTKGPDNTSSYVSLHTKNASKKAAICGDFSRFLVIPSRENDPEDQMAVDAV